MHVWEVECESKRENACGVCWRVLSEEKEVSASAVKSIGREKMRDVWN